MQDCFKFSTYVLIIQETIFVQEHRKRLLKNYSRNETGRKNETRS